MRFPPIPFRKFCCLFRKYEPHSRIFVVCLHWQTEEGKGGEPMAKDRFVEVYSQGIINVVKIIVDTETGVNYLLGSHDKQSGTGMTVLVDQNGKPVVTPIS